MDAVDRRRPACAPGAAPPARWRGSSAARSGGGPRSARTEWAPITSPAPSKRNSGSADSTSRPRCAAALARGQPPPPAPTASGSATGSGGFARPAKIASRLVVVEPGVGADAAAVEARRARLAVRPQLDLGADREALLPGREAARLAAQGMGQHRLDRPRHVGAVGAAAGLEVERRAGRTWAATSAMWIQTRAPSPSRRAETASSKSRALAGSTVKVGSAVRSRRRPARSPARRCAASAASTSSAARKPRLPSRSPSSASTASRARFGDARPRAALNREPGAPGLRGPAASPRRAWSAGCPARRRRGGCPCRARLTPSGVK